MWQPPQRIAFKAAPGRIPTREEAAGSRLFSPLNHGPVQLTSRTWVPAMVPWRADPDGNVTQAVVDWYARLAEGQPGCIVIEATGIRDVPSGPLLRVGHDRYVDGLRRVVDAIHRHSEGKTRAYIQLIDFLGVKRRPEREKYLERFLIISEAHRAALGMEGASDEAVRLHLLTLDDASLEQLLSPRQWEALQKGARERVTDTELPHIRKLPGVLPELFANAARRSRDAGFDGVELHYAHAYTMASFLSPTNTRDDGYGGGRFERLRLPLEVFRAVRDAVGADYPVGCRMLAEECIEGGSGLDDAVFFALGFARAGMDFLSFSRGGKFDDAKQPKVGEAVYPYTGVSGYECMPSYLSDDKGPFGRNLAATAALRRALREEGLATPVVAAGGIHNFDQAEAALAEGVADIIGSARQSLADPGWWKKLREGRGAEVRQCEYKNYCEGLDQKHKDVTCQLWDRVALDEPGLARSRDGKRRLVAPADW
ncbi:MAG: NADH:flavin oxidoreductase [Rhodocyclales bacterium]|nr:NADH:flavin oxidoreductase [Rhodocyclales bacterium]